MLFDHFECSAAEYRHEIGESNSTMSGGGAYIFYIHLFYFAYRIKNIVEIIGSSMSLYKLLFAGFLEYYSPLVTMTCF